MADSPEIDKGILDLETKVKASNHMIDLKSSLGFKNAFYFPIQNATAVREVLMGALWLCVPFVGWLMNMGHRIIMIHKMQHGLSPWPSWVDWRTLLKHGFMTWLGMVYYYFPAGLLAIIGKYSNTPSLFIISFCLFLLATLAIPGYMSHYCKEFDYREIFNPFKALRRALQGGMGYWRSWLIALSALCLSLLGLLVFGLGFLVTSVWFWQVAGFSFANTFTRAYDLQ